MLIINYIISIIFVCICTPSNHGMGECHMTFTVVVSIVKQKKVMITNVHQFELYLTIYKHIFVASFEKYFNSIVITINKSKDGKNFNKFQKISLLPVWYVCLSVELIQCSFHKILPV